MAIINIPNQITLLRLILAAVFFAVLSIGAPVTADRAWVLAIAFVLFVVAAITDFLDGYLARKWGQVTAFGRVVDPVVDKVLVCGAFVYFASPIFVDPQTNQNVSGVAPWMAVLILMRELLISAIRSFSEAQGAGFGANWVGKVKTALQMITIGVVLGVLAWWPNEGRRLITLSVWATVLITAYSLVAYVYRARDLVLSPEALGGEQTRNGDTS